MDVCFVTAKLTAKKGMEAQLEAEVVKNIPNVRAEKGCIRYDFHKNRSEDGTFLFYEIWEDRKSTRLNSSHSDRSRMPSSA